jgi:lysyl-tRNA synthetase class 2
MFLEQKNKEKRGTEHPAWEPTAPFSHLKVRAETLDKIRNFFKTRGVLEVETPILCHTANTDPFVQPIPVFIQGDMRPFYLQTSPEFAMKRLLAAGSGSIYQITKAFRNGEQGRNHNLEFSMLEWYRLGFNHHDLMDEISELLSCVLESAPTIRLSYTDLFLEKVGLHPLNATLAELQNCASGNGIAMDTATAETLSEDDWLDLLMTHCIEPTLGFEQPVMVYDFPISKAALARIRHETPPVAERFEVYVAGLELANGYHELQDPKVQLERFEGDCAVREKLGLSAIPIDDRLIAALTVGFPSCSGVALGIDRLIMLKLQSRNIEEVLTFPLERA